MGDNIENNDVEICDCEVEDSGVVKVNGLEIKTVELPNFVTKQVDSITQSSKDIEKSTKKAAELKEKANELKEKVGIFRKREAILDLQKVVKGIVDDLDMYCDALSSFQTNFENLSKTSEVLLGLSLVNSAQRNMVIRTIQLKLENASKEKLTELSKLELRRVLEQLNAQQELEKRVTSLKEKYDTLKQQMNTLQDDIKDQLEKQDNDVVDRLKESKTQMDGAIQQAKTDLQHQLDAQKTDVDSKLKGGKEQMDGAIKQAKTDLQHQLDAQKMDVDNRLSENEGKFTSFENDLNTLLNQGVEVENKLNEHKLAFDEQKQKSDSFVETTTAALAELSEKCEKLIKKSKRNGWRYFVSALIGCGFAALAFYLRNYVF